MEKLGLGEGTHGIRGGRAQAPGSKARCDWMWLRTRKCQVDWKEPASPLWGSRRKRNECLGRTLFVATVGFLSLPLSLPSSFPMLVSAVCSCLEKVGPVPLRELLVEWEPGLPALEGDTMSQCPLPQGLRHHISGQDRTGIWPCFGPTGQVP